MSYTVYQAAAGFGDLFSDISACSAAGGKWNTATGKCDMSPTYGELATKTICEAAGGTYNAATGECSSGGSSGGGSICPAGQTYGGPFLGCIPTVIPSTPTTPKTGFMTEAIELLKNSPLIKDPGITPSVPGTTKVAAVTPTPVGPVVTPVVPAPPVPVPPVPVPPKKGFLTTTNLLIGAGLLGVLGIAVAVSSKKLAPAPLTARGRK